jgi:5-methylcytosine-specific restriction endonuclease McrA
VAVAQLQAKRAQRHGRDLTQDRAYQHYSRDPADVVRDAGRRRRARLAAVAREPYEPSAIFERDGWSCWLCGRGLDPDAPINQPAAPTVDHVVPLAAGGPDTPANLRAACRSCNSRRGAQAPPGTRA